MSIKKLLLSVAATAIGMTALASSAMAAESVIKDVATGNEIANGTVINAKGWAKFEIFGTGIECHVSASIKATGTAGTTGEVTAFAPITPNCRGFGSIHKNCRVTADTVKNLPWSATTNAGDIDVTGNIVIDNTLSSCTSGITFTNLSFSKITLKPLKTGTRTVTNTDAHLGLTAATGASAEPIAGFELSGEGSSVDNTGTLPILVSGELEIEGTNRCTYKLV